METGRNLPVHLAAQCSDKILMHINRPSNFQQTMDHGLEDLSHCLYTDLVLVPAEGEQVKIHGFLLSAASPFLNHIFNNTISPNLEHTVMLPDVEGDTVTAMCQLLYGVTVVMTRERLVRLYQLVDLLCVQLSLSISPQQVGSVVNNNTDGYIEEDEAFHDRENDNFTESENVREEEEKNNEPQSVRMLKIDDKNDISSAVYPVAEETVNTSAVSKIDDPGEEGDAGDGRGLPICCWQCSRDFNNFASLSQHLKTNHQGQGRPSVRRHHRCPRCGAMLGSMWKLRQHLASHQSKEVEGESVKDNNLDHQYGRSSRSRTGPQTNRRQAGDHGYATASSKPKEVDNENVTEVVTPPGSAVCSEHSYGTLRDSSPEPEDSVASREKTDHIYSVANAETAGDIMIKVEDSVEKLDESGCSTTPGRDHQYTPFKERSSPRFRRILSKGEDPVINNSITHGKSEGESQNITERSYTRESALFPCLTCGKNFPQAYRLRRHVREVHDKEKLYKCGECLKEFFKSTSLIRHKISVHDKVRPFACPTCDSRFKDRSALKYHVKKKVCRNLPGI